jgi:gamma-glutamyltranspeptidase/glutathione hydrolase
MSGFDYGSGRSAAGFGGAAVAGHPSSALAGANALAAGGSAVDACLAMAACDWAAMPDMCGPGGDLFALWRTPDGKVAAVNGGGPAPAKYRHPASEGERSAYCLVPGAPAAFAHLATNVARLGLDAALAPAEALARRGTAVGARLDKQLQALPDGALRKALAAANGGRLPRTGERLGLPGLADSLAGWRKAGSADGELAAATADWRKEGSSVGEDEALAFRAEAEAALALSFGAWTVFGQPPLSQAVGTLAALGIAGADSVREDDPVHRTHMLVEAYKRAYAGLGGLRDGNDPHGYAKGLLAAPAMRAAREAIDHRAGEGPAMSRNYGETTQVAAVDADGTVCTLIHSLYRPFGGRVLARNGWISNDRGAAFGSGDNAPVPGRRPRHTLVGILMTHPEEGSFAFGTPGAQAQTQTNLQVAVSLMRDPAAPAAALAAPRWSFIGGAQIAVEARMPARELDALAERGHRIALRPPSDWLMGSVGLVGARGTRRMAVADHRREALALAI